MFEVVGVDSDLTACMVCGVRKEYTEPRGFLL